MQSRFTPEEMESRQKTIDFLGGEITRIRDLQRSAYVKGYTGMKMATMAESEMFKGKPGTSSGAAASSSARAELTDSHRLALRQIKERDAQIVSVTLWIYET